MYISSFTLKVFAVLLLLTSSAVAQTFRIRALDIESSNALEAISISHNGRYLLIREVSPDGSSSCPVRVDQHGGARVALCDSGLVDAIKVNDKGSVLGYISDRDIQFAAVWRSTDGVSVIHDPQDVTTPTQPQDLDDLDRAYAYADRVIKYIGLAPLYDPETTHSYQSPRALIWNKSHGARLIFPNDDHANLVVRATNSGRLLVMRASQKDPSAEVLKNKTYFELNFNPYIKTHALKLKRLNFPRNRYFWWPNISATSAISDKSPDIVVDGTRLIHGRRPVEVAKRYRGERNDSPNSLSMAASGLIAGFRGYNAFIDSAADGAIDLSCLIPQNRVISGTTSLTAATLSINTIGGISENGSVFVGGDLNQDGHYNRLFLIEPIGHKLNDLSESIDFCPSVSVNELSSRNSEVRYEITVHSGARVYPGIHLKLVAYDTDPINDIGGSSDECPSIELGSLTTDASGSAKLSFRPNSYFYFEVMLASPDDARYAIRDYSGNHNGGVNVSYGTSYDYQCTPYQQ